MTRTMVIHGAPLGPGRVRISGHKHSVVPIIAASLCTTARVRLGNVPAIADPIILSQILEAGGAHVAWRADELMIDTASFSGTTVPAALSQAIHGSVYLIPAILGQLGRVRFERAGGCMIGETDAGGQRPLHHMLSVLRRFGAEFTEADGAIEGRCREFRSCDIDIMEYSDRDDLLTGPLVSGATKTAILAALCVQSGRTRIRTPYPKPDVTELVAFARACGVDATMSNREIVIDTRHRQNPAEVEYHVVSDLSEVMTYVCASVVHRIPIAMIGVEPEKLKIGLAEEFRLLDRMGVGLRWSDRELHVRPPTIVRRTDIEVTSVGIYSDHQPFFALMLLGGDGPSTIREQVWTGRFDYARELIRLGADIEFGDASITVHPSVLRATDHTLFARDLRAAATLLLAAIGLPGRTTLVGVDHLVRGYVALADELTRLGARLTTLEAPERPRMEATPDARIPG